LKIEISDADEIFFNGDARGYALKINDEFVKDKEIFKDWGGYGIIAPDFRNHLGDSVNSPQGFNQDYMDILNG
jgi:hypothetical protein